MFASYKVVSEDHWGCISYGMGCIVMVSEVTITMYCSYMTTIGVFEWLLGHKMCGVHKPSLFFLFWMGLRLDVHKSKVTHTDVSLLLASERSPTLIGQNGKLRYLYVTRTSLKMRMRLCMRMK